MTTLTGNLNMTETKKKGVVAFICKNIYTLMSSGCERLRSYSEDQVEPVEIDRDDQFNAYVHNRMNILIMWVQHLKPRDVSEAKRHLDFFLHDMEHHFVDPYAPRELRKAYQWIRAYIKVYPAVTKKDRTQKAFEMIERVYQSIGIEFPLKQVLRTNESGVSK